MKNYRKFLAAALCAALTAGSSHAAVFGSEKQDGGRPGSFLDYAASARSLGMGQAHVGVADDASATYWNPAGLSQLGRRDFVTVYSALQEDTSFGFASYAQPTRGLGSLGVSVVSLRSGDYRRTDAQGNQSGTFSTASTALLLSNSVGVGPRFSIGGTLKGVRHEVADASSNGFGADLGGMFYATPILQFGLVVRNLLAPRLKVGNATDSYPRDVRAGVKWRALRPLVLAFDAGQAEKESARVNLGADVMVTQMVALRAGLNNDEFATGLGLALGTWGLDYAFGYPLGDEAIRDLGGTHKIGLHVSFGQPITESVDKFGWRKQGRIYLASLQQKMADGAPANDPETKRLVSGTKAAIQRDAYTDEKTINAAQAYVYYFQNRYEPSAAAFKKALAVDPGDDALRRDLQTVESKMSVERREEVGDYRIRHVAELYREGDWEGTIKASERILFLSPGHKEATEYLVKARRRITEPEMKRARQKYDAGNNVGAVIHLRRVKEIDPDHAEATSMLERISRENEELADRQQSLYVAPEHQGMVNQ